MCTAHTKRQSGANKEVEDILEEEEENNREANFLTLMLSNNFYVIYFWGIDLFHEEDVALEVLHLFLRSYCPNKKDICDCLN